MSGLFKFCRESHAVDLFENGRLRIGTLHDYRSAEHKPGVQDAQEGFKTVSHVIGDMSPGWRRPMDVKAMNHFNVISGWEGAHISNVGFSMEINHPNCFIFCVATNSLRSTMSEFPGYDVCLSLLKIKRFVDIVEEEISRQVPVSFFGRRRIIYESREWEFDGYGNGLSPAWIKDPSFARQFEYRFMWRPIRHKAVISPVFISSNRLKKIFKHIEIS